MAYAMTLIRAVAQVLMYARQGTATALDPSGVTGGSVQSDAQRVIFDVLYEKAAAGHPGFRYKAESFTASAGGVVTLADGLIVKVVGAGKHDGINFRILNGEVFHGNTSAYFRANETIILDTYRLPDAADTAACFEKLDPTVQQEIVQEAIKRYRAIKSFDAEIDAVLTRRQQEFGALSARTVGSKHDDSPSPLGGSFGGFGQGGGRGGRSGDN
jgi:hypothetical protein